MNLFFHAFERAPNHAAVMKTALRRLAAVLELTFAVACWADTQEYGKVELLRDTWGVPHVFSHTDRGAMYGLGYATAQERGFQMTYGLRVMQGRLAEVIGDRARSSNLKPRSPIFLALIASYSAVVSCSGKPPTSAASSR